MSLESVLAEIATPVGDERGQVHNWLYSFLPVGKANYPALVGFCKNCRHTFYYVMQVENISFIDMHAFEPYKEFEADIPKWGCVPVDY